MTIHNLGEHLSWLLHTKPSVPDDNVNRPAVTDNTPLHQDIADDSAGPTSSNHAHPQVIEPISTAIHAPRPIAAAAAPDMAKLRANMASKPSTVPAAASRHLTGPMGQQRSEPIAKQTHIAPINPRPARSCSPGNSDLEILDLTEDVEQIAPVRHLQSMAGRKRKSEELYDNYSPASPTETGAGRSNLVSDQRDPSRQGADLVREQREVPNSSDEEGGPCLRDRAAPLDPPPPYSTLVPGSTTHVSSQAGTHRPATEPSPARPPASLPKTSTCTQTGPQAPSPHNKDAAGSSQSGLAATISTEDSALLLAFAKWDQDQLQRHHVRALEQHEQAISAYVDALDQGDAVGETRFFEEQTRAKAIVDALDNLRIHRDHLQVLEIQKQNHLQSIRKALRSGAARPPDTGELNRIKTGLENAKAESLPLLRLVSHLLTAPSTITGESLGPPKAAAVAQRPAHDKPSGPINPMPAPESSFSARAYETTRPVAMTRPVAPMAANRPKPGLSAVVNDRTGSTEDDDAVFDTVMGSPPSGAYDMDDFDEFGDDDDDNLFDLVDKPSVARPLAPPAGLPGAKRRAFTEVSNNITRRHASQYAGSQAAGVGLSHPWSDDVVDALKDCFHLKGFRSNQLDAINATLAGRDVFVLMPTGGGKSLCYQLPAIISSGHTRGITIVISPLISLMEDQLAHLRELGIRAGILNSKSSPEDKSYINQALAHRDPESLLQILYVTPEMLSMNQAMINKLERLHERKRFARIVIDEAHCVSQWGHDFRKDYTEIGNFRNKFKGVPLMALTATATENVKQDVINNLSIRGCEVYTQSFDRPNLYYEVRSKPKGGAVVEAIASIISSPDYAGQCGIVYCNARAKCELIAKALREQHDIQAKHYHAMLEHEEKTATQRAWQAGEFQVIVATIAFGMGIDKPNVRFVIHHSLPSTLEGYYQETGRAGRDGRRSACFLFYSYADTATINRHIDDSDGDYLQKERKRAMLRSIVAYCENKSDCRRTQVLGYFSEKFPSARCKRECDNCRSPALVRSQDFTKEAKHAIELVRTLTTGPNKENVTLIRCVDILRGVRSKTLAAYNQVKQFASITGHHRSVLERLLQHLLSIGVLLEDRHTNKAGFPTNYVKLGRKERNVTSGSQKVTLSVQISTDGGIVDQTDAKGSGPGAASSKRKVAEGREKAKPKRKVPLSTNVSSPAQARPGRRKNRGSLEDVGLDEFGGNSDVFDDYDNNDDDDDDDSDDGFAEVRIAPAARRHAMGPPITTDQRMESLPDIHRILVEQFVDEGIRECKRILIDKNLKALPFTESNLREMGVHFPGTLEEMAQLPNLDPIKVQTYGKHFITMLRRYQKTFREMMKKDEVVEDPNHEVVINLCTDEEDNAELEDDEDYGSLDDDFEEQLAESSAYFDTEHREEPRPQAAKPKKSSSTAHPRSRSHTTKRRSAGGSREGRSKGSSSARKVLGGTSRHSGNRVSKKSGTSRKSSESNATATGNSKSLSNFLYKPGNSKGGERRGGIGMMPT